MTESKVVEFGSQKNEGYFARLVDDELIVGEKTRESGSVILYKGLFKHEDTPYIFNLGVKAPHIFINIVNYFNSGIDRYLSKLEASACNNIIQEVKDRLPKALYDKVSERLNQDNCQSIKVCVLSTLDELKQDWEDSYGRNLVWIPGHYEERP